MSNVLVFLAKGGPVMIPIAGLSIATTACALERGWFWLQALRGENRLAHLILETARQDWGRARVLAEASAGLPIARFLLAGLKLHQPTPETFRLALETQGDREFIAMRKGDKLLETIVGIAPLLGLLGTVTGLILTFLNLRIGGGSAVDTTKAALGISEALITTAGGMVVAILALLVYRVCVALQSSQIEFFSDMGNELELIYRQVWYESVTLEDKRYSSIEDRSIDSTLLRQLAELIHQIVQQESRRKV
jgi:biopolymer transport protein ExbB